MNEKTSAHFDEEALVRWQMGDAAEAERVHLAGCADCQARTRSLADSLSWFGAAARQWGEEKAVASENLWERKPATSMNWRGMVAAWAMVSVALLLVFGIGLQRWKGHRAAIEAQVQAAAAATGKAGTGARQCAAGRSGPGCLAGSAGIDAAAVVECG